MNWGNFGARGLAGDHAAGTGDIRDPPRSSACWRARNCRHAFGRALQLAAGDLCGTGAAVDSAQRRDVLISSRWPRGGPPCSPEFMRIGGAVACWRRYWSGWVRYVILWLAGQ